MSRRTRARKSAPEIPPPTLPNTPETPNVNPAQPSKTVNAYWTREDEFKLLHYLVDHKAEAGDGGSFPMSVFSGASLVLDADVVRGGPKTAMVCKNKWQALRNTYALVLWLKSLSGFTWSDEHGMNVTAATTNSWNAIVKQKPKAKQFKNKGWPYLSLVTDLAPSKLRGTFVYRPGSQSTSQSTNAPSPTPEAESHDSEGTPEPSGEVEQEATIVDPDEDSDHVPLPTTTPSRKRSAAPASAPVSTKKTKLTPQASLLQGLSTSIERFGESLVTALAAPSSAVPPTPQRRQHSVAFALKHEGWLSREHHISFLSLLEKNTNMVDVYTTLADGDEEFRKDWVRSKLGLDLDLDLGF
ncbi:hypothetical protein ONZ45_g3305 [Pleurotus djamor]|nr:hypothetical protein ONZ45_g3305 [Pleurotus djamor]